MSRRPRIYVNAAQILSGLVAFVELLYFGLGLDYYVPGVPSSRVPVLVAISNTAGVRVDLKWLLSTTLANPIAKRALRSAGAASTLGPLRNWGEFELYLSAKQVPGFYSPKAVTWVEETPGLNGGIPVYFLRFA